MYKQLSWHIWNGADDRRCSLTSLPWQSMIIEQKRKPRFPQFDTASESMSTAWSSSLFDHPSPRTTFRFSLCSKWNIFSFLTCWREQKKLLNSSIIYPSFNSTVSFFLLDSTVLTVRLGRYMISTCLWNRRSRRTRYCLQRNCVFATLAMISSRESL